MKRATIITLIAVTFAFGALLTCALEGCKLGPDAPAATDSPPLSCPTVRCKPAPALDLSSPWDAGTDAR